MRFKSLCANNAITSITHQTPSSTPIVQHSYTYDSTNNIISYLNSLDGSTTYDNRLTKVSQQEYNSTTEEWQNVQIVEYAYDYNNVWIRKTVDSNTTIFIPENYQTTVQLDNDTTTHHYLWTPQYQDKLLADTTTDGVLWTLTDHLGSIRDIISNSSSGIITQAHIIYDAYGEVISCTDSAGQTISNPILFAYTGKAFDTSTALQNNINRWYDASIGRWLNPDPIGFEGNDTNLYRYVLNVPVIQLDTKGLESEWNLISREQLERIPYNHSVSLYYTDIALDMRHSCIQLDWSVYYKVRLTLENECGDKQIRLIGYQKNYKISYELVNVSLINTPQQNAAILSTGPFTAFMPMRSPYFPNLRSDMWAIVRKCGGCSGKKDPSAIIKPSSQNAMRDKDFMQNIYLAAEQVARESNGVFYHFPDFTCNSVTAEIIRRAGGQFGGGIMNYPGSQNNFTY